MSNPCIASIFMSNLARSVVETQNDIVAKFNSSNIAHYNVLSVVTHGQAMNEVTRNLFSSGHDAILFLDIDCVPLDNKSFDYLFDRAYQGKLVGNAQRSNHIENNQHVFAGAHNVCFTADTYSKLGTPSFEPTDRGDVAEELTYKAEEFGIPVELLMPLKYDAPPIRMSWETSTEPFWRLAEGMPNYGIGTTYGPDNNTELFWHCWQSFHPGQQERFISKCKEILESN